MVMFFRTLLLLVFASGLVQQCKAQSYSIPGGQIQPQIVFPIFFEDRFGGRDTIYTGWDPTVLSSFDSATTWKFGVQPVMLDSSGLSGYWEAGGKYFKVNVGNMGFGNRFPAGPGIIVYNSLLPLTISWDTRVLHDLNMPYPDVSPAPLAQIHFSYSYSYSSATENGTYYLQSGYEELCCDSGCMFRDSIVISPVLGHTIPTESGYLIITIGPWTNGVLPGVPELDVDLKQSVIEDELFLQAGKPIRTVSIYQVTGALVVNRSRVDAPEFRTSLPAAGIWFVQVAGDDWVRTLKVIRQ